MKRLFNMVVIILSILFLSSSFILAAEVKKAPFSKEKHYGEKVGKIEVITTVATYSPVRYEFGRVIADVIRKLGVDAEVNALAYSAGIQRTYKEKNFDAYIIQHSARPIRIDPYVYLYQDLHSSNEGLGGRNLSGWNNRLYDTLMEEQVREMDLEKRRKIIFDAQWILHDHLPYTVLTHNRALIPYNSKTFTNNTPSLGSPVRNFWSELSLTPLTKRKVLRLGRNTEPKTLNPFALTESYDVRLLEKIYDKLMQLGPDGSLVPWAAKSYKVINDITVDVTLRENMQFHDGKPVTVEDVKFSFDYLKQWNAPYFLSMLRRIKAVTILDNNKVRFELTEPFAPFLSNTLAMVYILPKHIWQDVHKQKGVNDPSFWENAHPIGSGPYKFGHWKKGETLKLVKNEKHFHAPKADGILYIKYGSVDAIVGAMEMGEIDVPGIFNLPPHQAERLLKTGFCTIPKVGDMAFFALHYNTRRPPFNDMFFRRAVSFAIPRTQMLRDIMNDQGSINGTTIAPANKLWNNPNIPPLPEDINRAKLELKNAGYTWDKDGALHYPSKEGDKRAFDTGW